jgi:hypothetical protein
VDRYEGIGRGLHPVPTEWRSQDRERDQLARDIEDQIAVEEQADPPGMLYLLGRVDPQAVQTPGSLGSANVRAALEYDAGSWWFTYIEEPNRPWQAEPHHELDVVDVEEAQLHAREHLAWILAAEELGREN